MSRNGSGTYSLPAGNPVVTGTTISSTWANNTLSDIATALTQSIAYDGQTTPTANLPMGGFKHTGVAVGASLTDYSRYDQVQNSSTQWLTSVSGTDTITASLTVTPSAYAAGQTFRFVSAGANTTTSVTLNINSLGAKSITKNGATALAVGDIPSGAAVEVIYDGTQFQIIGIKYIPMVTPGTSGNVLTSDGTNWISSAPSIVPVGCVATFPISSAPSGWLKANGAAISRTTYSALFAVLVKSSNVTISIATPGVVTWNSHGLASNDPVVFSTTGALPTGLTAGTTYYVVGASITTNTFQVSATAGGSAINTSGTQSGTHTAVNAPWGAGDGSTTFNVPDLRGEFLRGLDDGRGVDANRSLGSAQSDQVKAHNHMWSQLGTGAGGNLSYSPTDYSNEAAAAIGASRASPASLGFGSENRPRNIALLVCIKY